MHRIRWLLAPVLTLAAQDLGEDAVEILNRNCVACHGSALKSSNLDLRTRESILAGGERGEAMVPNYPDRSRLYVFATHQQNPTMPPGKKLSDPELETLRKWILAGAPWPAASAGAPDAAAALKAMEERPITAEERSFWAFRKPVRATVPVGNAHPVDAFLRQTWKAKGLRPSPLADKRTLVRRAYLDLVGLPPTREEVYAFLTDTSVNAWEKLVDRLLESPHYGERWARHWLDLVRYADSGGYEYDNERLNAYRFRDWVIRAFNQDMPYNRFVLDQLAGDEIDPQSSNARIATGFLRLGPEQNIKNEMTRLDELDDIISTTSLTFLGITLQCARCHNHKFDPIPQKDYYQIQAVFFSTKGADYPLVSQSEIDAYKAENKRIDGLQDPLKKGKADLEKTYREILFAEKIAKLAPYMQEAWRTPADRRTEGQRLNARQIEKTLQITEEEILARMPGKEAAEHKSLVQEVRALDKQRPKPYASAMSIGEQGREALPSFFLHRGNSSNKGSRMEPGILTVADWGGFRKHTPPPEAQTSHRRRSFAEWVAAPDNPLTARVMVNRIWQRHFGEGIVSTPNNFGLKGERPTHPELLDWLATEFVRQGWSIKAMHRLIMTSQAYRMASDDIEVNRKVDATNRYLWRMGRQRLDIEAIRDSMLAAAGTLDRTVGGAAVLPYIDPALFQSSSRRTWNGRPDNDPSTWRRSLYVFNKRSIRYPMFESFDQPDMITSCARRNTSVTAPQALLLMNNASVRMHARKFAERLQRDAGSDAHKQVDLGFELALVRLPDAEERARSLDFIQSGPQGLEDFCQALFNLNEFVFMR